MSGDVPPAYAAAAVNIPSTAVSRLAGIEKKLNLAAKEASAAHAEIPVVC